MKIQDIAEEACKRYTDPLEARGYVRPLLEAAWPKSRDPELRTTSIELLVKLAVGRVRNEMCQAAKGQIPACKISAAEIAASRKITEQSLLDTFLIGSKFAGDCLGAELDPEIASSRKRSNGELQRGHWLQWLRKHTPNKKRVRDCVKADVANEAMRVIREQLAGGLSRCDIQLSAAARKPLNNGRTGLATGDNHPETARRPQKRKRVGQDRRDTPRSTADSASAPLSGKAAAGAS